MDSIGKIGERLLMVVFFFAVPAILFILFNDDVMDRRVAAMADEFIMDVTKDGVLTREEYVIFADRIASLNQGFEIALEHQYYIENPYYEYTDEATLHNYFKERNVLQKAYIPVEPQEFEPPVTDGIKLQEQTNASVLASVSVDGYVPLPEDTEEEEEAIYEVVLPVQECYDGENLVTVVRVTDNGLVYYLECDPVTVTGSGTAQVPLTHNGVEIQAIVNVTVYPKIYTCTYGHETVLTRQMVDTYKVSGSFGSCAICAQIPESISVNASSLSAEVGTSWEELALDFTVTYMDGHTGVISFTKEELYHNYDANYCGTQTVALSFKGLLVECFSITLNGGSCVSCGVECSERSFSDYSRFHYCDVCLAAEPFFLGDTYIQEDVAHHMEITERLDVNGEYLFNRGDYLKVTLKRLRDGIPVPFLSNRRTVPIISDGFIRTKGRSD